MTVSAHLEVLAEGRFVLVDQRGNPRFYRIHTACVECFPSRRSDHGTSRTGSSDLPTRRRRLMPDAHITGTRR